ncbi:MAG TPA: site-2 protease family protein [Nitrospirota bacterium]|nr:site-2 protease family protein [Nitrospirota bacterium]
MEELSTIQKIAVMALPLVFAIILHEVAHGWVAYRLGDPTAKAAGRLTLNPISHIDLFGTIIMPLLLFMLTNGRMVFGYAKPVPINPSYFREPKKGMALSALAGPAVNILMAVAFSFLLRVVLSGLEGKVPEPAWSWFAAPLSYMCFYGIIMNVVLAVLNMIPIPPLDGSRLVYWLLPDRQGQAYYRIEPFGTLILMVLIMVGALGKIMGPVIAPILMLLLGQSAF